MLHGSLTVLIVTIFNIGYINSYNASDECQLPNGKFVTVEQFLEKWNSQAFESATLFLNFTKAYEQYLIDLLNFRDENGYEKSMEIYTNATRIAETLPLDADALLTLTRRINSDVTMCNLITLIDDSHFSIFDFRNEKCELPNNKFVTIGQFLDKWNSESVGSVMSLLNWTKVYDRYQTDVLNYFVQNGFDKSMELYTDVATIAVTHPLDAEALLTLARYIKPYLTPCDLLTLIEDSYFSSLSIQNEVCELPNGKCVTVGRLLKKWNAQTLVGSVISLVNWTKVDDQYETEVRNYYNQNGFENSMELLTYANTIAGIRPLDANALLTLAQHIKPDVTICNLLAVIDDDYFYAFNLQHDCVARNFEKESK